MIIWLASYPRSGNTFLRIVFNSVFNIKTYELYSIEGKHGKNNISDIIGHKFLPENFDFEKARISKKKYYIKTHELVDRANIDEDDKIIYLVRNGLDSTLSFEKYLHNYEKKDSQFLNIIHGNTPYSSWAEHTRQWHRVDNKLIIKFEELIDDPMEAANKIAQYLHIKPINDSVPTFEELHKINSQFFRKGEKHNNRLLSELELGLFWVNSYEEMVRFRYTDNMPDELIDANKSCINKYKHIINDNEKKQLSDIYNFQEWVVGVKIQKMFKIFFPINTSRRKMLTKLLRIVKKTN